MLLSGLPTDDIPDNGSKGFQLENDKYFAVKKSGKIFIYKNSCPHIGIALEWVEDQFLDSTKTMIQCANHGALFVIESGRCVSGPCSGQKLKAVPFSIVDGKIFLD